MHLILYQTSSSRNIISTHKIFMITSSHHHHIQVITTSMQRNQVTLCRENGDSNRFSSLARQTQSHDTASPCTWPLFTYPRVMNQSRYRLARGTDSTSWGASNHPTQASASYYPAYRSTSSSARTGLLLRNPPRSYVGFLSP